MPPDGPPRESGNSPAGPPAAGVAPVSAGVALFSGYHAEETVSEMLDCLQRDRSPEFLEVKEALFPDVKQALFAEVKEALQSYAADVRKPAAIDRPAAR